MRKRDPEAEIRALRERIAMLVDEAANNERLLKKTQARELELLKAENLLEVFETIVQGLAASYTLDVVTLAMADPEHEIRHLLISERVDVDELSGVIFTDTLSAMAPQFSSLQKPWLGPYIGADHQLLFPGQHDIKSVALIPLRRQDRLLGSINFGSADTRRFSRHLGTEFLAHLGVIASFAIENAVNRARLVRSGLTDFLTGWNNRRYLHARMKEELARAQRTGHGLACLLIDVDLFKQINDQHGHHAGDIALREVAQRVNAQIRGSDAAARFGGDEFVVLVPDSDAEHARLLAERIRKAVCESPVQVAAGVQITLTLSIGVAAILPTRESADLQSVAEALMGRADVALYQAKDKGRNRVAVA